MNKYSAITIIAILIIIAPFVYSGLNIIGAEQLQYKWNDSEEFSFFKKMILKGGIFQGVDGFTVALTTMFNTYMKYIKLNELYDNNKDPSKHFPKKNSDKK